MELIKRIKRYAWTTEYYSHKNDPSYMTIKFTRKTDNAVYYSYIDSSDYEMCSKLPLYVSLTRGVYIMYCDKDDSGKKYNRYLHKTLLSKEDMHTDHINMNPLDNRRSNLRLVTCSENLRNASMQSNNSLGRKGLAVKRNADGSIKTIRACFTTNDGQREKSFDVNKYGYDEALRLANNVLDEMQPKFGITISHQCRKDKLGF